MQNLDKVATAAEYHRLVVRLRANRRGKPVTWGKPYHHHKRRRVIRRAH